MCPTPVCHASGCIHQRPDANENYTQKTRRIQEVFPPTLRGHNLHTRKHLAKHFLSLRRPRPKNQRVRYNRIILLAYTERASRGKGVWANIMIWNVSAEVIAFIIVLIISVYSGTGQAVPSNKNRLFRVCLITTLGAIGTNLASTLLIAYGSSTLIPLTWLITSIYFILTPLMGTVYFYYAVAVVSEVRAVSRPFLVVSFLPCALYLACVVANGATGCLFSLDAAGEYYQGSLILTTYVVFYFYCIACFLLVAFTPAAIDPAIKRILGTFPLIAVAVIAVQQAFPAYLLSGSAAACSLLIIYLYLQNKRLSVDSLTGISNRNEFLSMVNLLHKNKQSFTAMLLSLSNFKFINDRFGHENGDRFLKEFATYLKTFDNRAHLYRYSGDQFALIVGEGDARISATSEHDVEDILEEFQQRMKNPWQVSGHTYTMSAAIGLVSFPAIVHDPKDLVAALEYATKQARRSEQSEPCACTPAMMDTIHRRSLIASVLREAVDHDGFTVQFQPVWSEGAERFVTAEALCRLTDDELGSIPPDEFIPIAEQVGLISDITSIVLERSCSFIAQYRAAHPTSAFRGVSVNFSPVQFMQGDLANIVLKTVERHGIPASCLRIEITEGAIIANPDGVRAFMETMHNQGVRFYLDDFGTGYSNISTLLNLPFDVVKLDKSILWSAVSKEGMEAFIGYLTAGFAVIGPSVLSEGVETEEQRLLLNRCGIDLMQGYLFARPLDPEAAASVIAASEADA